MLKQHGSPSAPRGELEKHLNEQTGAEVGYFGFGHGTQKSNADFQMRKCYLVIIFLYMYGQLGDANKGVKLSTTLAGEALGIK